MANQSESKPRTVLNALINNTTSYANLDYNYGPYADVNDATEACAQLKAPVGFTCGVLSGSKVIEYQVRSGATEQSLHAFSVGGGKYNQLLLKQETPEPSGSGVNLSLSASRTGADPENGRPYTTVTIKNNDSTVGSFNVYDGKNGSGGSLDLVDSESKPLIVNSNNKLVSSNVINVDTITGIHGNTLKVQASGGIHLGDFTNGDNAGEFITIQGGLGSDERYLQIISPDNQKYGNLKIPNGKVEAKNGFYESSDARLKTDIQTVELDYDQLLDKIRPVLYHWKFDQEGPLELGFIAQEIQELVPQVVSGEKQLSVNYAKLSTVALGACKHLMQRLNQLENRVKDIEEKLK